MSLSFDGPRARATRRRGISISGPSAAQQHFKEECDVNVVVKRYARGDTSVVNPREPQYGDFSMADELLSAHLQVEAAEQEFLSLPAEVRRAAGDSMEGLLRMLATEDGAYELQEAGYDLGLPDREEAPEEAAQAASQPVAAPVAASGNSPPAAQPEGGDQ